MPEASALVVGHLGGDPTDTSVDPPAVPDAVAVVVSRMVARVLTREAGGDVEPVGAESVTSTTGPFGQTVRFGAGTTSGGPWLTAADKVMLKPHRAGGGFASVGVASGRTGRYRRVT